MKNITALSVALLLSLNVLADEPAYPLSNLTLAAVDTGASNSWASEPLSKNVDTRMEKALEEKTSALNEKINAQLEKALEEKLNRELQF